MSFVEQLLIALSNPILILVLLVAVPVIVVLTHIVSRRLTREAAFTSVETSFYNRHLARLEEVEFAARAWEKCPFGAVVMDQNTLIVDVNGAFLDFLGLTKEEMVGYSLFKFLRPEDRAETWAMWGQNFDEKQNAQVVESSVPEPSPREHWPYVNKYVHKDGSIVDLHWFARTRSTLLTDDIEIGYCHCPSYWGIKEPDHEGVGQ